MSKRIWTAEMFREKNEMRKANRAKDAIAYRNGRRLRKDLTHNGCFGNFDSKQYNEVAIGTSGHRG